MSNLEEQAVMSVRYVAALSYSYVILFSPFVPEALLNNIKEFSMYFKENTTLHHYKDQLDNAALKKLPLFPLRTV
jgi:hypothetical protein